jgi:DNA invertase Pin-like site-specific DNA recombinase
MKAALSMNMRAILYARVSTEGQREASLDDQLRECEDLCKREQFEIVGRFKDFGASGEETNRPQYQAALRVLEAHGADVFVAHELSRLWRSPAEQASQMEQFEFRGSHVVTCNGIDTRREGFEFSVAVEGARSKTETKRIATRVHRSLKGNVIEGRSAGGRAYGYRSEPIYDSTRTDAYGRHEIVGALRRVEPSEAAIVRRIFALYADGTSPRNIAGILNAEAMPSPGAAWRRKTRRRDAKWLASAIHGDPKRASGILNNETYLGNVVWNRRQMRKRPRTSKRIAVMRSGDEQISRSDPALQIVSVELWERVKARQKKQAHELGTRVRGGLRKHKPGAGPPARYMLSGFLKCDACGAGFVLANASRYACASHTNGGDAACSVSATVPRVRVEAAVLDCIETDLLDPVYLTRIEQRCRTAPSSEVGLDPRPRIAELDGEIARLVEAIASVGISDALAARLKSAETERAYLLAAGKPKTLAARSITPATLERRIALLRARLAEGGAVARAVVQELFPHQLWVRVEVDGKLYLELPADIGSLIPLFDRDSISRFPIGDGEVGNLMVAGVGFRTHRLALAA